VTYAVEVWGEDGDLVDRMEFTTKEDAYDWADSLPWDGQYEDAEVVLCDADGEFPIR
jgi:hypothetical protein